MTAAAPKATVASLDAGGGDATAGWWGSLPSCCSGWSSPCWGRRGAQGEPLGPDNPGPEGARAVAQILQRQGVDLQETDRLAGVLDAAGPDTTVLLLDAGVLPPQRLRELRSSGAGLVVVAPTLPVLQVLAPEVLLAGRTEAATVAPGVRRPGGHGGG